MGQTLDEANKSAGADEKSAPASLTIDPDEIEKFSAIADEWWDPFGKFRPLHKFNPVRLAYIRDIATTHFGRDRSAPKPLAGLRLIDIGCGGGLVAEPMCRLGAEVTAIDAAERNVKTAMAHAQPQNLPINYRAASVEQLHEENAAPFDIVLNLEVVEHVADVNEFLQLSAKLMKPGGLMIVATINRTLKALALAKIGAEYILRWLPAGTHDPSKFVKPDEVRAALRLGGAEPFAEAGVTYNPLMDAWSIGNDTSVNYMICASAPK